jgi:excisionase family DNA binding protein
VKPSETLDERLDPNRHPTLTVSEYVDLTGLDRKTVLDGVKRGEIPAMKVGRALRIPTVWARSQIYPTLIRAAP